MVEAHKHTPLINSEHFHSLPVSLQTEHPGSCPGCHIEAPAGSFTLAELRQLQTCTETHGTFRYLNYRLMRKGLFIPRSITMKMAPTLKALYAKKTYGEKKSTTSRSGVHFGPLLLCPALSIYLIVKRQKGDVCSRDM